MDGRERETTAITSETNEQKIEYEYNKQQVERGYIGVSIKNALQVIVEVSECGGRKR